MAPSSTDHWKPVSINLLWTARMHRFILPWQRDSIVLLMKQHMFRKDTFGLLDTDSLMRILHMVEVTAFYI